VAKTTATYDDGDAASSVLAYTDADGAKAPTGVCAYVSGATAVPVTSTDRLPVTLGLTDAELRASAVAVSLSSTTITGTVGVSIVGQSGAVVIADGGGSLTVDGTVAVSGSVAVTGTFWQATQPVSGPLTDAELRATAVPVSLTSTTVTGTVAVAQSGSWAVTLGAGSAAVGTVAVTDSAGSSLTANATVPTGADIPGATSGLFSKSVICFGDGSGDNNWRQVNNNDPDNYLPVLAQIAVNGEAINLNNPLPVQLYVGGAEALASATTTPGSSARGLVVRQPEPQTLTAGQVSVATTAGGTQIVAARSGRRAVVVTQHGTTAVYLGPTGVTTSTGLLLTGTAGAIQVLPGGAAVFGITASGSQTVSFAEVY
jgi:hypothetical protein